MADFINWLHGICIDYDLSILIVAHHGKKSSGEPGFDIRGASATPGATDVNIGLYKKDGFSDLVFEGRDIPGLELSITWDNFVWKLKGNACELRRDDAENNILSALKALGNEGEAAQIAVLANISRSTAYTHLEKMKKAHIIESRIEKIKNTPHIKYFLAKQPNTPTAQQPPLPQNEAKTPHSDEGCRGVGELQGSLNINGTESQISGDLMETGRLPNDLLDLWNAQGRPVVYLGDGASTQDLEFFIAHNKLNERQILALNDWYVKNNLPGLLKK